MANIYQESYIENVIDISWDYVLEIDYFIELFTMATNKGLLNAYI